MFGGIGSVVAAQATSGFSSGVFGTPGTFAVEIGFTLLGWVLVALLVVAVVAIASGFARARRPDLAQQPAGHPSEPAAGACASRVSPLGALAA
jgi:hypothetical protein